MRKDYFRIAAIGFIASLIFYFISYYFEHSGVSLVIALVLLAATIYIFVLSIIRSKPTPPSPPSMSQPSPPSQTSTPSQPSPPSQTVSPSQTEAIEETAAPAQSSTPPSPQTSTPLCPTCGQPLVFLEDSKKWYCQNEKKIVITPSQIIEKELESEKRELHKELDILEKHMSEGKVSKKVYRVLKHKYKSRLKEIE